MNLSQIKVWHLKKGLDRRFKGGHPWVYSNELTESPKGIQPGQPIKLCDASGAFQAYGYGNPHSLIAFRELSRNSEEIDFFDKEGIARKLASAIQFRESLGFKDFSYRLCFGEADGLPGLIIDRYRLDDDVPTDIFSIQPHTAGAEALLSVIEEVLSHSMKGAFGIIERKDVGVRKLEGLNVEESAIRRAPPKWTLEKLQNAPIRVRAVDGNGHRVIRVDLIKGQKTGFFLDQWANIRSLHRVLESISNNKPAADRKHFAALDLCSYVGQWPVQLAPVLEKNFSMLEWVCVDGSEDALAFTQKNFKNLGLRAKLETRKGDVLKDLQKDMPEAFDLVIADPPAFIKSKKDAPQGKHAYLQLFTESLRQLKDGGWLVACSCSAHLTEDEFAEALAKAARRDGSSIRFVSRGENSPDHPYRPEFLEGRYLKCWIGQKVKILTKKKENV